jgi:signal transduction histidine kinase
MAGTAALTREDLRRIDLFEDLDDGQLDQWLAVAEPQAVAEGTIIAEQGEQARELIILFEGAIMAQFVDGDRFEPVGRNEAPTWMGAIAVLTEDVVPVRMVAVTDCRMATVPAAAFTELALTHRSVHRRIMRQVGPVIGRLTAVEQNRERLAALGTMAAGLAHELNNPAAAATRAASDMAQALDVIASTIERFVSSGVERAEAEQLVKLQQQAVVGACELGALGALDAADAEDELLDALEDLGVEAPWELAETLSRAGVDARWLERVRELAGPATGAALRWIVASVSARELAEEVRESTERISHLVKAVKAYAYMDRGALVEIDIHEGLETTITVLAHKLKHTAIEIERDYDRTLPPLSVYGSELNQVWTNLLDNAIDALGDRGTITVRTRRDGPCVIVDVADDGPGIDPETSSRIFEPFFTTKPVGAGTGLGLDTARRIVEERHRGSLWVDSQPGATVFHVRLPIDGTAN